MSLRVTCPGCSKRFQAPDSAAGRVGKCPTCGATFALPSSSSGSDANLGVDRPFDDADFDEPMAASSLPDVPFEPTPLSQMYAPATATRSARDDRPQRNEEPPTRKRYRRVALAAEYMDWLQWGARHCLRIMIVSSIAGSV
jgi:hypothetical protein